MSTATNKPSHHVYTVREGGQNGSDFWTKVGVAFSHKDMKGFSLLLEAMPINGKLTIRTIEPKTKA
jgi:hypothetical protein